MRSLQMTDANHKGQVLRKTAKRLKGMNFQPALLLLRLGHGMFHLFGVFFHLHFANDILLLGDSARKSSNVFDAMLAWNTKFCPVLSSG